MTSLCKSNRHGRVIELRQVAIGPRGEESRHHAELQEAKQEQREILRSAEAERERILQKAEKEIEQWRKTWEEEKRLITEEAFNEGRLDGFEAGRMEGFESYKEKISEANRVMGQAKEQHDRVVEESEQTILRLAVACAEKVVKKQLDQSDDYFLSLVRHAVKEVQDQPEITVKLHPDQYELLHHQMEELQRLVDVHTKLVLYADIELSPYACVIESPFGMIRAGVDSQLSELREKLFEAAFGVDSDE